MLPLKHRNRLAVSLEQTALFFSWTGRIEERARREKGKKNKAETVEGKSQTTWRLAALCC